MGGSTPGLKEAQANGLQVLSEHFGMKPSQLARLFIQQGLTQNKQVLDLYAFEAGASTRA